MALGELMGINRFTIYLLYYFISGIGDIVLIFTLLTT